MDFIILLVNLHLFRDVVLIEERKIIQENLWHDNRKIIALIHGELKKQNLHMFMSETKNLRRIANKLRKKKYPTIGSIGDLDIIPEKFKKIDAGRFLRYNGNNSGAKILIFASETGISTLCKASSWHGDGTFETTPSLFYQVGSSRHL